MFKQIDRDGDNYLSKGELGAFVVGMQFEGVNPSKDEEDIAQKLMQEFDVERPDDRIDQEEFTKGISKLLNAVRGDKVSHHTADTLKYLDDFEEVSWLYSKSLSPLLLNFLGQMVMKL